MFGIKYKRWEIDIWAIEKKKEEKKKQNTFSTVQINKIILCSSYQFR